MKHGLLLLTALEFLCCIISTDSFQIIASNKAGITITKRISVSTKLQKDGNIERRDLLSRIILSNVLLTTAVSLPANSETTTTEIASTINNNKAKEEEAINPAITHKVFFDIRISRSDGTFYVRDDIEDTSENTVYHYRLTFGLFGTIAPTHVSKFLSYVNVTYNPLDDSPLPSYSTSGFTSLDQSTGLVSAGNIPGLQVTDFNGAAAIRYAGRLIPATPWIDKPSVTKVSHTSPLLLTHKPLDLTPAFAITTRSNTELDYTNTIFGSILPDESSREFLEVIKSIPTYSLNRQVIPTTTSSSVVGTADTGTAQAELASKVFTAQKVFFRGAAKSFGDTRIGNVYEGKFLRRVEVTKVGII